VVFNAELWIQHFKDPDPILIQGFADQKLKNFFLFFSLSIIAIYLCPSYRRSLPPSEENIQHFIK
jgi:hypothetical protein